MKLWNTRAEKHPLACDLLYLILMWLHAYEYVCKGIVISLWFYASTWQYVKDYVYMVVCMWMCIWFCAYDCAARQHSAVCDMETHQLFGFGAWLNARFRSDAADWVSIGRDKLPHPNQENTIRLPCPIAGCNHTRRPTKRTGFDQCLVWPMLAKRVSSPSSVPFCWSNVPVINPLIIYWDDARHLKGLYYRDFEVKRIYHDTLMRLIEVIEH